MKVSRSHGEVSKTHWLGGGLRGCGSVAPSPLHLGEPYDQEVPHAQEKEGAVCLSVSIATCEPEMLGTTQGDCRGPSQESL